MIPKIVKGHICFSTPNAQALRNYFPDVRQAEVSGENIYAVPATLDAARLLRNIGIEAPSPIRSEYDWPIIPGRAPYWWQVDTAEFLTLNPRCFCLNQPRTGKTMSTLWAIDYLQKIGAIGRCLVVAPLSTLEIVWGESVWYNFPRKKHAVLHGSADKRRALLKQEHDIYLVNFDGIEIIQEELRSRSDITHVVIDEIRTMFNAKTKRWKAMKSIITPERTAWGLTGTPTPNAPTDAYGQMKLIKPENFTGHFTHFKNTVMQQFGVFKWVPRRGHEEIVKKCLSPAIRFTRDVVTDMEPQLIERHTELSPQQAKHLNELMKQAVTDIEGNVVTAVNAAVLISKIIQASLGAVIGTGGEIAEIDFGPRLKVIEDAIEENNEKVILFLPFTAALNAYARELKKKWSVAVVDGGVSAGARAKIFSDFQREKDPHVLVAHPACMAHGLELASASLIIWGSAHANADQYGQANCRIDGGAQKVKIDIMHITATRQERMIFQALREKRKLQDVVCELFSKGVK